MQTIILPGFSEKNSVWLNECASSLSIEGIVRPVSWDHWKDSSQTFDPKEKGWLIARHSKGDKMNIVAKSLGTLVSAYVAMQIPEQINKMILLGIPLSGLSSTDKKDFLSGITKLPADKIICFQNENDPHGSFLDLKKFLPEKINLINKPGDNHEYYYFEEFNKFLLNGAI
jgi:pimeloyl-ACP methyl ester carboxylesterase